jgi:hypothetical protein
LLGYASAPVARLRSGTWQHSKIVHLHILNVVEVWDNAFWSTTANLTNEGKLDCQAVSQRFARLDWPASTSLQSTVSLFSVSFPFSTNDLVKPLSAFARTNHNVCSQRSSNPVETHVEQPDQGYGHPRTQH